MKTVALLAVLLLPACAAISPPQYGKQYPVGEQMPTSCAVVTSFAPNLRSSPKLHGPDAFVGYYNMGEWGRNPVFLVAPIPDASITTAAAILRAADPGHSEFWSTAQMLSGTLEYGEVFEVLIPAKERPMGVRSKIVDRDAIVVRAHIQDACGRRFLVAVQANPVGDVDDWTWKLLRDNYAMFVANIKWPR